MTQKNVQTPLIQALGAYILDNPTFSAWAGSMALATCLSLVGGPNFARSPLAWLRGC